MADELTKRTDVMSGQNLVRFNPKEVVRDLYGLLPSPYEQETRLKLIPALRERLKNHLTLYFNEVKTMHPITNTDIKTITEQDLIVFIFFDKNKERSQYDQQIDTFIQMLATIYFYTGNECTLEQLSVLLLNRVWI